MKVFRYLAKEVFITLAALIVILSLILISNQMVGYLNRAASGRIPGILILQLMGLEMPNLLSLLLPMGFYISIILAYGRLYSENEMLVLHACGLSIARIVGYTLTMAIIVSSCVLALIYINPAAAGLRAQLLQTSGVKAFIQILAPQQFHVLPQNQVLYIDAINRGHTKAEGLFLAKMNPNPEDGWQWQIIAANQLALQKHRGQSDELLMTKGSIYRMAPGSLKAQYGKFDEAVLKIPEPTLNAAEDLRTIPFAKLWKLRTLNPAMHAELEWRLSIPIMTFILALIAVPLSRVQPRSGKFSKILPAIIIFLIYTNILFVWRERAITASWQSGMSMWWVHLVWLSFALILLWRHKR